MKNFLHLWGSMMRLLHFHRFNVKLVADNPLRGEVTANSVFVVGTPAYHKWAYLQCPCGCGDILMLSLAKQANPSWRVKWDRLGRPSLSPSVNKTTGCRSHFWLRKGKIEWAKFEDE